ncbi:CAP domain-containing protein [Paracoccus salsus]|uniref:CAP domain-containing protein n=1 Tax=Paracoccus salsus TaxID=2911061 RepID=UPI001F2E5133|nr:CAP domain-containing protein [Paracoccus salsus]MCF3973797.1 CAP domain-containing protein [Paracoccus salsus]
MRISHHLLATLACCAVLGACADQGSGIEPRDPHDVQATAPGKAACLKTSPPQNSVGAQATNAARSRAGLAPVRANMLLAEVAAQHACDMATRGVMTHRGSKTKGPGPRVKARGYAPMLTAENIAAGPFDLSRVLSEWNASQGHRDNIMIPQVRDYGIGQAIGSDGRTRFWAAIYAAPR